MQNRKYSSPLLSFLVTFVAVVCSSDHANTLREEAGEEQKYSEREAALEKFTGQSSEENRWTKESLSAWTQDAEQNGETAIFPGENMSTVFDTSLEFQKKIPAMNIRRDAPDRGKDLGRVKRKLLEEVSNSRDVTNYFLNQYVQYLHRYPSASRSRFILKKIEKSKQISTCYSEVVEELNVGLLSYSEFRAKERKIGEWLVRVPVTRVTHVWHHRFGVISEDALEQEAS